MECTNDVGLPQILHPVETLTLKVLTLYTLCYCCWSLAERSNYSYINNSEGQKSQVSRNFSDPTRPGWVLKISRHSRFSSFRIIILTVSGQV